jgi:hypothetical protein
VIELTQQERDKFAAWLEHDAKSNRAMADQMLKMDPTGTMGTLATKYKNEAAAASIIAAKLRSIETTEL